ncbi:MAG: ElyC/SanA/YdcF family protein [Venatoribacter sp.]
MLLMPIGSSLLALVVALVLWKKSPKTSRALVAFAAIWLGVSSWAPASDFLLAPFEQHYPMFSLAQPVEAVVVLGGCHATDTTMPPASQLCSSSIYRLLEGIRILNANPNAIMLVSGYAGSDSRSHAEVSYEVAVSLGVSGERIYQFPSPRDTQEEAEAEYELLKGKRFALVTEASHLPRAMSFYQRLGLKPIAAPAMRMSVEDSDWRIEARATLKSERAIYEFLGLVWQKLKSN